MPVRFTWLAVAVFDAGAFAPRPASVVVTRYEVSVRFSVAISFSCEPPAVVPYSLRDVTSDPPIGRFVSGMRCKYAVLVAGGATPRPLFAVVSV